MPALEYHPQGHDDERTRPLGVDDVRGPLKVGQFADLITATESSVYSAV